MLLLHLIANAIVHISAPLHFAGIYRDDGIIIFKREYAVKELEYWLTSFQNAIKYSVGNDYLYFRAKFGLIATSNQNTTKLRQ